MPQDIQSQFAYGSFTDPDTGLNLPYRIYVPEYTNSNQEYSFLLFLHGAGQRGTDNQSQIQVNSHILTRVVNDSDPARACIVLAPQCPNDMQWVDTPWGNGSYAVDSVPQSQPMQAVMKLIEDLESEYRIDQDRMYISGISMGGYGTWDTIIRYPDTFAAAIPVCGAGDPTKSERIKDVSIWTFHSSDDSIVPISGTRDMVQALEAVGGDIQYTEYSGYGHESWEPAFNRPELLDWLFFHQKKSPMQSVDTLEPIAVPYGTAFTDLPLPDAVNVTLENGETRPAAITWSAQDASGRDYDGNLPGTYTLSGTLAADGASNPQNLTATIQVAVEAQPVITDIINPEAITVPYGTAFADLPLPDTVTVQLSDDTQTTVNVLRWDTDGDPAYDGNISQTYTLTGHLTETVPNPQNLTASIQVAVGAGPADKGDIDGDGDVDIQDVMGACKILARKNAGDISTDDEIARGDLTGDGQVTIEDIMAICKILARQSA